MKVICLWHVVLVMMLDPGAAAPRYRCEGGKYAPQGQNWCSSCTAGKYSNSGASYCSSCKAGKYSNSGASYCSSCKAGKYSSSGASYCSSCTAGKYSNSGASYCSSCTAGKYSNSGADDCRYCPADTFSKSGWPECYDCPKGKTSYRDYGSTGCQRQADEFDNGWLIAFLILCPIAVIASCIAGYLMCRRLLPKNVTGPTDPPAPVAMGRSKSLEGIWYTVFSFESTIYSYGRNHYTRSG